MGRLAPSHVFTPLKMCKLSKHSFVLAMICANLAKGARFLLHDGYTRPCYIIVIRLYDSNFLYKWFLIVKNVNNAYH